jgi:hypothetical protein
MRLLALGLLLSLPLLFAQPAHGAPEPPSSVPDPTPSIERAIRALDRGKPSLLSPLLPRGSKVHLSLSSIGPARGLHGGGQVVVLLDRFFFRCSPDGYTLTGRDGGVGGAPVNLHGTLRCRSKEGPVTAEIHLTLELSNGAWRLSEVWETG